MLNIEDAQKKMLIIALFIIAILIIVSIAYWGFLTQKPTEKEEPEEPIDDRISPLENQGLILEINRIRHRGLLDKLMKFGTSWKNTPIFYFISNMDGLEYISKDVSALAGESEIFFTGWDTMFQENKVVKDADEEQEMSKVTLTIMERETQGLFGRQTKDVEKEKIQLVYDYRTGRWSGDDFFMDEDGYGHYVGEKFEMWFNLYQIDCDEDGIPYWTEVNVLHTDPMVDDSHRDPDGDGVPTAWEWKWGYDPHVWDDHENLDPDIDGIENIEEYQMAPWFADPFSQDIYIEADSMQEDGLFDSHVFWEESQQALIERFAQHGINMYIDDGWPGGPTNGGGETLTHYDTVSQDSGMMLQFYNNHFPDERKGIFRYMVIGHSGRFTHPSEFYRYDTIHVGTGFDFVNTFLVDQSFTPRTQRTALAAAVMHEVGHTLGITPWTIEGCDNLSYGIGERQTYIETWGNYYSVMNYFYTFDKKLLDYSDGSNGPPYDQNDWEELYLPNFQMENVAIEDPAFETPGKDKIVWENIEFEPSGWNYSKKLTQQYVGDIGDWTPVAPVKVNWRVYVKTDNSTSSSDRNLRVYAQPIYETTIVPDSEWTLIKEGYVDDEGNIKLD